MGGAGRTQLGTEIREAAGSRSAPGDPRTIAGVPTRARSLELGGEARVARDARRLLWVAGGVAPGAFASSCCCLIRRGPGRSGGGAAAARPPPPLS